MTTNPWKQFQGLLPKASRIIGTIACYNGNGTSTLILRDGVPITVRGQSVAVNSSALIEGGEMIREVPKLPAYNAQV